VNDNHRNVTIRNGTVLGFDQQLRETGRGNVIEDMRLDGGYEYPIVASGAGTLIRRNLIVNYRVGGLTVGGSNSSILDNDIGVCDGCFTFGIQINGDHHFVVNNRVTTVADCGIQVDSGTGNKIRDNIVDGATTPYCGGVDVGNNH
jgi:parallel beta helix pectate lyase-like protein